MSRQRDSEWGEHWSERRPAHGVRDRLRALFQPRDGVVVEAMIAERARELEARAAELAGTVTDLEGREARARGLRAAVEQLLQHGAAELDEREAHLNELAAQLAQHEAELRRLEHELAERRSELGAVELHRAAVERREAAVSERERAAERRLVQLGERVQGSLESERERVAAEADASATSHVLFVAGERYRLVERDGPVPPVGAELEVEAVRYRVLRHGTSPLPGDSRRCAVLERLTRGHE